MLIAHLPAGWLLARRLAPILDRDGPGVRRLLVVGLAASVLPDVDLLYFYVADERRTLHHDYWTHIPIFWPILLLAVVAVLLLGRLRIPWRDGAALLAGIMLHLLLDTVAGGIAWLYPWNATRLVLVDVPARFDWWVWNFVLHWSFLLEVAIILWALREAVTTGAWRRTAPARIVIHEGRRQEHGE